MMKPKLLVNLKCVILKIIVILYLSDLIKVLVTKSGLSLGNSRNQNYAKEVIDTLVKENANESFEVLNDARYFTHKE